MLRYAVATAREAKKTTDVWTYHVDELCRRVKGYAQLSGNASKFKEVQRIQDQMADRNND